ncbi:hypothetical protein [Schinkia azotoformans]|uniref:hypothetical protein n=1 Tax=Schinkia azotoformans TaxID=1454 RepID=UPI002DB85F40|nr:hypothetical protein [Schinkia azotoformans]MEC1786072.1 hypothetical protein [Schinkia azotoformans]MED4420108.1 hypothetical protein [Schinkia azotoformans]
MTVVSEFNTVKKLVLHVLENYPETRNNDNKLFVRCAEILGINSLSGFENMDLNLISVYKLRQKIQNQENLYMPTENVRVLRKERQKGIKEYMSKGKVKATS